VPGSHTEPFVAAYQERYSLEPAKSVARYEYDSMMVVAEAMRRGSENGAIYASSIQKGLSVIHYYGVSGPKVFNKIMQSARPWITGFFGANGLSC